MQLMCTRNKEKAVDSAALDLALRFGIVAQKHFPDSYVYLFGSHAKGIATLRSDIDVAVIVDSIKGAEENPHLILDAKFMLHGIAFEDFHPVEAHLIEADRCQSGLLGTVLATGIQLLEPVRPNA